MKRGHQIAIAALVVAFILVLAALARPRQNEPIYNGKTLSQWLLTYVEAQANPTPEDPHKAETAEKAVRAIGTNAIPVLLAWTDYRPQKWRDTLLRAYYQTLNLFGGTNDIYKSMVAPGEVREELAIVGFEILGPEAHQAIPELVRRTNAGSGHAALALAYIGPGALNALLTALNHPKRATRFAAAAALGSCRDLGVNTNAVVSALALRLNDADLSVAIAAMTSIGKLALSPEIGVPALAEKLGHRDPDVRSAAITSLGEYGSAARQALPALYTNLTDRNEWVRLATTNALTSIAPDADEPKQSK